MRMRNQRWSVTAGGLWLLLAAAVLSGADPSRLDGVQEHWRWSHFDESTGLPSKRVHQILRGNDGTAWVSTAKGAAWYDGYFWHPATGLAGEPGIRLSMGQEGRMIAFHQGCVYEGGRQGFRLLGPCRGDEWFDAAALDTGEVLASTASGMPRLIQEGGRTRPAEFTFQLDVLEGLLFQQTRGGAVWWADSRGFFRAQKGTSRPMFGPVAGKP